MAWTDLEVANRALVRMGIHKQLAALPDTSSEGKAIAALLPALKERILSAHDWKWAMRHAALTAATGTPDGLPFDWTYAYALPADLHKPLRLWDGARRPVPGTDAAFQIAPVFAALAASAVTQSTPSGNTPGTGTFTLTGTPTEAGAFSLVIAAASSEPMGGGEAAAYALAFKDGIFVEALELAGAMPDFPYDGAGIGLAGVTIAMSAASTAYSTGDTYSFSVSGTEATAEPDDLLLTDTDDAELLYLSNGWLAATPTLTAPAYVSDALAWLLAAELAMPLAKRPDLSGYLEQKAAMALRRARDLDSGTAASDPEALPFQLRSRG